MTHDILQIRIPSATQEVEYEIDCLGEDLPVRGNIIASGDNEYDKQVEDKIIDELEWNEWAWCCVKITAKWKSIRGHDYLGACSYKDEEDFKKNGCYEQMCDNAYEDIVNQLKELANDSK